MSPSAPVVAPQRVLIIQVRWGPFAGRKAIILPGRTLRVGRAESMGLAIAGDSALSEAHFELTWDGQRCQLRNLCGKTGTLLDGEFQQEGEVPHGAWVRAGTTTFSVYREAETPAPQFEEPVISGTVDGKTRVLAYLRERPEPLFAVLDASMDPRILVLLRESVEECRSLYEGPQGDVLEDVAPYLVSLPKGSRLLEALVYEGWGRNWGVFLTSLRPFHEVRRHFRKFLMVQDDVGRELYFRFYDPRVLRVFLPTCTPQQAEAFFEGISVYLMEADRAGLIVRLQMRACIADYELVELGMK